MAGKFYAVKKGRKPGIYMSWDACKAQVMGFPNARYKGFKTKAEAEAFLNPDANELMQIDEDTLVAYVDGSYDHSQKRFSYGMVLMHDGVERYFAYPYADEELATMRNVAGEIFGVELKKREEVIPYAKKLQEKGAKNVLVSMAGEGAVLIDENGREYMSPVPKGKVVNAVGAGDSMVAGFIAGYLEKKDYEYAFHMGIASGSASAFSEQLATRAEVEALLK